MQYTLGQAIRKLSTTSHAYGADNVADGINDAIQALAGLTGWECLRKVLRIFSAQPSFALPQGCAGLVRACVGGRPVSVRGQDFEFLHSGPGDIRTPPPGFSRIPNANIVDRGFHPLMLSPKGPFRLFAISSGAEDAPELTVTGLLANGELKTVSIPVATSATDVASAEAGDDEFQDVVGVVVDDACAGDYTNLYALDADGSRVKVAQYHPAVAAPRFHRYEIQNMRPCTGVDLLVEVRLDPLPLIHDTDIIPFDSLEPIEWMMQASWYTKSGEIEAAQKMHSLAMNWLKARETTEATVQTPVIVNSLFPGSPGEVSMEAVNI